MTTTRAQAARDTWVNVYVAIYKPTDSRDPHHWAICVDDPISGPSVHQIVDQNNRYLVREIKGTRPERAGLWKESILVGQVTSKRVSGARTSIQLTPANNHSRTWNCQDWVQETLPRMVREGWLVLRHDGLIKLGLRREYRQ